MSIESSLTGRLLGAFFGLALALGFIGFFPMVVTQPVERAVPLNAAEVAAFVGFVEAGKVVRGWGRMQRHGVQLGQQHGMVMARYGGSNVVEQLIVHGNGN
ncbi:hypothetical protein H257_04745 [Aphanomyces astaci]|uniref:Uncharacterized protein n=1 Tax=Aphanomyces astaci TaxID=112090 RepID=W4GVC9_APHAT|nr:hypothetical protein H257_04745 [Aphanomyces astaci]ETV82994.1 hypothetical protein H257_04745 [Aphanomyces astaci]|eukprot:XP_009827665.1 hypothetical protein H257_04745 [Aphanomyces astaci]